MSSSDYHALEFVRDSPARQRQYVVHGVVLSSGLAFPELSERPAAPGASVALAEAELRGAPASLYEHNRIWRDAEITLLWYAEEGCYVARAGTELLIAAPPGLDDRVVRRFALGRALAIVLHQRGRAVLHGIGLAREGAAIAVLGASGAGKSTLAAALCRHGGLLMTDDVLAVDTDGRQAQVSAGPPEIRLCADAATLLGEQVVDRGPVDCWVSKRRYGVASYTQPAPLPLRDVFVLANGPRISVEPLTPRVALALLRENLFPSVKLALDARADPRVARRLRRIVDGVQVWRLVRPGRSLDELDDIVAAITAACAPAQNTVST